MQKRTYSKTQTDSLALHDEQNSSEMNRTLSGACVNPLALLVLVLLVLTANCSQLSAAGALAGQQTLLCQHTHNDLLFLITAKLRWWPSKDTFEGLHTLRSRCFTWHLLFYFKTTPNTCHVLFRCCLIYLWTTILVKNSENNCYWTCTCSVLQILKCPCYGLWKVHILVLGVPNNRWTCMQGQKTISLSYNMHLFLPSLLNDSQTIRSFVWRCD